MQQIILTIFQKSICVRSLLLRLAIHLNIPNAKKSPIQPVRIVWGALHKKDKARTKHGLAPEGNKLVIVYAQARSKKDFERVLATYKDAEKADGLSAEAVWSNKRGQLSMITGSNLIVHVNVRDKGTSDRKSKSITIA